MECVPTGRGRSGREEVLLLAVCAGLGTRGVGSCHRSDSGDRLQHCFYVVRKHGGRAKALEALPFLRDVFQLVDLTAQVLNQAMDAGVSDLEDAIQYFSALHAGAEVLVTRNPDDFP